MSIRSLSISIRQLKVTFGNLLIIYRFTNEEFSSFIIALLLKKIRYLIY